MSKLISISPEDLAAMQEADAEITLDNTIDPYLDELDHKDRAAELLRQQAEERAAWKLTPKSEKTPDATRKHRNRMNTLSARIRYHNAPPDVRAKMRHKHNEQDKRYYSPAKNHAYYMKNRERILVRQAEYDKERYWNNHEQMLAKARERYQKSKKG